jgi:crossover junction endodeoxyribonuclease RuvC
MFDAACVLGVDPGIARVGLGAIRREGRKPILLWADTVRTPADLAESARLRIVSDAVRRAIAEHRPGALAVERVAWNRNASSAMAVARATGVILLAGAEAGLSVVEYGPLEVKMAITGIGNADKKQVQSALVRAHGLKDVPSQPDAADAVAVALCHLTQSRLRAAADRAGAR